MPSTILHPRTLLSALLGVMLLATPAAAVPPERETLINRGIFAFPDLDCGDVQLVTVPIFERVRTTTYFDRNGTPVRRVVNGFIRDKFVSSTGEEFKSRASFLVEFDPVTDDPLRVSGLTAIYTRQGEGVVYLEAGMKIFDENRNIVFAAGPKDFEELGLDGICEALTS